MYMLEELKEEVWRANLELSQSGLILFTWGNVSGYSRETGCMAIKPSGVPYEELTASDIVVVDVETGKKVEGDYRPSTDAPTHCYLYSHLEGIGGITHAHSTNAAAFAQAGLDVPALGTTHADYFYGAVPCARGLTEQEVDEDYEGNTGKVIVEEFRNRDIDPIAVPGVLTRNHGPFTWGGDAAKSVFHAVVLEQVAEMALKTLQLNASAHLDPWVLDKHYQRKHGKNAYYGQES